MTVMLKIKGKIFISDDELNFKFSRSSGPGGQNVNKVNTRVTVFFDIGACEKFSIDEKKRILKQLATRIDKNGVMRVVSQKHRTQKANRVAAIERLGQLLCDVLKKRPVRKKTRIPYAAEQKRLEDKKRHSLLKQDRTKINHRREMEL